MAVIGRWATRKHLACVTDQETLTYSNLCGLYRSLTPETLTGFEESLRLQK